MMRADGEGLHFNYCDSWSLLGVYCRSSESSDYFAYGCSEPSSRIFLVNYSSAFAVERVRWYADNSSNISRGLFQDSRTIRLHLARSTERIRNIQALQILHSDIGLSLRIYDYDRSWRPLQIPSRQITSIALTLLSSFGAMVELYRPLLHIPILVRE